MSSSPLSWTGSAAGKVTYIGYSLGGGIAAAFASHFPNLVSNLILIAPAGLVRTEHISTSSKILYSAGIIPESILEKIIKGRLQAGPQSASAVSVKEKKSAADAPISAEVPDQNQTGGSSADKEYAKRVANAVQWQIREHQGFVKAFISSIRYGPVSEQHADWERIGERLVDGKGQGGRVTIITGNNDPLIIKNELVEDATKAFRGQVDFHFEDAGHELPFTHSTEVAERIWETLPAKE